MKLDHTARGLHQFRFLTENGLQPHNTLLDIGCGTLLRLGRHLVGYLHEGNYVGIDKEPVPELPGATIIRSDQFDFPPGPFDYAWAQSVFTHLLPLKIGRCLINLRPVLRGSFYATFNEGEFKTGGPHPTRCKEWKCVSYPREELISLGNNCGYSVEYLGDWDHWSGQKLLRFTPNG